MVVFYLYMQSVVQASNQELALNSGLWEWFDFNALQVTLSHFMNYDLECLTYVNYFLKGKKTIWFNMFSFIFLKMYLKNQLILCIGVSTPLKNTTPYFSLIPLLICKLSMSPFLDNPPQYIGFSRPPPKN